MTHTHVWLQIGIVAESKGSLPFALAPDCVDSSATGRPQLWPTALRLDLETLYIICIYNMYKHNMYIHIIHNTVQSKFKLVEILMSHLDSRGCHVCAVCLYFLVASNEKSSGIIQMNELVFIHTYVSTYLYYIYDYI